MQKNTGSVCLYFYCNFNLFVCIYFTFSATIVNRTLAKKAGNRRCTLAPAAGLEVT